MKKLFGIILVLALTIALAACGGGKDKGKTITVGASPAPHAEILEKAKPLLKKMNSLSSILQKNGQV